MENPWQPAGGNVTGAIWRITRETAAQRLMIQRGEAQIAVDLTSEDMDALKDRPGVVRVIEPEYRTFSIKMNTKHGPMADIELRKAVSYAFNYQAMLDAAGYADLMTGPLPNGILGHLPNLGVYRTDLAKAKSIWQNQRCRMAASSSPSSMSPVWISSAAGRWCCSTASNSSTSSSISSR